MIQRIGYLNEEVLLITTGSSYEDCCPEKIFQNHCLTLIVAIPMYAKIPFCLISGVYVGQQVSIIHKMKKEYVIMI